MSKKYGLIAAILVLVIIAAGCGNSNNNAGQGGNAKPAGEGNASNTSASHNDVTVKIGVQGKGGLFGKAQEQKWFEDAFGELGAKVEWVEFQSGPPMIEAMASNHLDFAGMGNMPPISAQAAGIDFKIISQLLDGKNNVAIIVPTDSPIKSIADLKGKKVAVTKGSNAYNFLYRVLDKAGLKQSDIQEIQLQPDETQPSFEGGKVDAWAVWDPYISLNTLSGKGRVLADGESEGVLSPSFQLVRSDFAKKYPDLVTLYLKTFEKARQWEADNQEEAFQRYADERSIPIELVKGMQSRASMINIPISDETIAEQQSTADFQFQLGTIRKEINVADVFDNQYIEEALK
ncbi:aliphatic sulfonate ABC transporter substrate-binding protein [Paenibacillus oenotherae]|uniref:Aliphatic sulfonate ABC transporter substrate-binding protein n=1 Tax=Paenibacillus oenotherae TaxID=1435645 RepID=A0ABS7D6F4_9BACL|nr:aliphatic sulfonate ABC transporter substrate-binding protein [Paenibacillus oenotherae]MBW7475517.1 aliphatic sulfonate ABC transporter substrate-binding protein [Paenibacillus oenotherae]